MGQAAERKDTGTSPQLSAGDLYRRAHKIEALAKIIMDCTAASGNRADSARAQRLLTEIAGIAGLEIEE